MKNQFKQHIFHMGIAAFVAGLLLKFVLPGSNEALKMLPFVMTGFGSGIICVGVAGIFRKRMLDKNPEKAKQYEIAEKDERNIALREKAGYATWYLTLIVLFILTLAFCVLEYMLPALVLFGVALIHVVSFFVFIGVYGKKI